VRRVLAARWDESGGPERRLLRFEITANAFCHQMVRSIVGTLAEVGLGRRSAGSIMGTMRSRDRARAGQLAPPHGLCLWEVGY
jgi:tRNA pseudouridine38-40 synthase